MSPPPPSQLVTRSSASQCHEGWVPQGSRVAGSPSAGTSRDPPEFQAPFCLHPGTLGPGERGRVLGHWHLPSTLHSFLGPSLQLTGALRNAAWVGEIPSQPVTSVAATAPSQASCCHAPGLRSAFHTSGTRQSLSPGEESSADQLSPVVWPFPTLKFCSFPAPPSPYPATHRASPEPCVTCAPAAPRLATSLAFLPMLL